MDRAHSCKGFSEIAAFRRNIQRGGWADSLPIFLCGAGEQQPNECGRPTEYNSSPMPAVKDPEKKIDALREKIRKHEYLYYVLDSPEISDLDFDKPLRGREPEKPIA